MDNQCKTLLVLAGDGIGPEVTAEALRVLDWLSGRRGLALDVGEELVGGDCYERHGVFISDETVAAARGADAVLFGAEGGSRFDSPDLTGPPEDRSGLTRLRRDLDLFANLRPVRPFPALADASSLKPAVIRGVDLVIVRELTGGIYFGEPRGIEDLGGGVRRAVDTQVYTTPEIERVARAAFELARGRRGKLCSVDKANVMESGILWRDVVTRLGAGEFADVALDHLYADNCAMQLVRDPAQFDVLVADNLFGDILSDGAAMIAGSLGMLPSASLGASLGETNEAGRGLALYEPVHGSAPDIAGRGIANPLGAILSVALMLRHSFAREADAELIERAVGDALARGARTADIAVPEDAAVSTREMGDAVLAALDELVA